MAAVQEADAEVKQHGYSSSAPESMAWKAEGTKEPA